MTSQHWEVRMICVKRHKCRLVEVVEEFRNIHHEPSPEVTFKVHQRRWFAEQDRIIDSGDSLDYDGPMI